MARLRKTTSHRKAVKFLHTFVRLDLGGMPAGKNFNNFYEWINKEHGNLRKRYRDATKQKHSIR